MKQIYFKTAETVEKKYLGFLFILCILRCIQTFQSKLDGLDFILGN